MQQRYDKKYEYLLALTDLEAKQLSYTKLSHQANKEDKASQKQVILFNLHTIPYDRFSSAKIFEITAKYYKHFLYYNSLHSVCFFCYIIYILNTLYYTFYHLFLN